MNKKEWIQKAMLPNDDLVNFRDVIMFTEEKLNRVTEMADEIERVSPTFFKN